MAECPSIPSDEEFSEEGSSSDEEFSEDKEVRPEGDVVDGRSGSSSWMSWLADKARSALYTAMGDILAMHAESDDENKAKHATTRLVGGPLRNESVAIIGGGPAGVHMAHVLRQNKFQRLTIFEKTDRIGGKSKTVFHRGAHHEMGTCYISPDYEEVKKLLQDFGLNEHVEVVGRTVYNPDCSDKGVPFRKWIFSEVAKQIGGRPSKVRCAVEVFRQSFSYATLHKKLLGEYDGVLMPKPSEEALKRLDCSIDEFLTSNDLSALKPVFLLAFSLQGYGFLERTSALYGLMWVTPMLLAGLVEQVKFRKALPKEELKKRPAGERRTITTLRRGFQFLWEAMVERDGIDVIRKADISSIRRDPSEVHIQYTEAGETKSRTFDYLVIAAPIQKVLPVLDAQEDEENVFSKVETSTFVTTLFDFQPARESKMLAVDSWFSYVAPGYEYAVWSLRDTHHLLRQSNWPVRLDDPEVGTAVSYQFADRVRAPEDEDEIKRRHTEHFERQGLHHVQIIQREMWDYFPHYGVRDMSSGTLWDILAMQGKHRTWYTGAWTCFEAINAIVSYNNMLVDVWMEQQVDNQPDALRALVGQSLIFAAPGRSAVDQREVDVHL